MTRRAAVLGCGNIGCRYDLGRPMDAPPLTHVGAYARHAGFELAGVCDVRDDRVRDCAARWPVPHAGTDWNRVLSGARPDVVSIATPPAVRLGPIRSALAAGARAIFCEKPLASSLSEAQAIIETCHAAGATLAVNFVRRWEPGCREVARLVAADVLGRVDRATGMYARGLARNGSHLIDLIAWWVGPIASVQPLGAGTADSPDLRLVTSGGATVDVIALPHGEYDVFALQVFGERAAVRLDDGGAIITVRRAEPHGFAPGVGILGPAQALVTDLDSTMLNAIGDLHSAMDGRAPPACGGAEGLAVMRVLAAAGVAGA